MEEQEAKYFLASFCLVLLHVIRHFNTVSYTIITQMTPRCTSY